MKKSKIIISIVFAISLGSCKAVADRNEANKQAKKDYLQEQKQLQEEREQDIQEQINNRD